MSNNVVIGSGLSVLGLLKKNNSKNFSIYEKNNYVGGHAKSHVVDKFYFDEGAHISHSRNEQFYQHILKDKETNLNKFKSSILNFKNSKEIGYPIQLHLRDLNFSEKFKILSEIFKKTKFQNQNNYYEWLLSNYGFFLTENYYQPYTKKYWRSDPKTMDINWVKGRLAKKNINKTLYSLFFKNKKTNLVYDEFRYPKEGGFFELFRSHYKNKSINLNSKVTKINLKKKSIIINNTKEVFFENLISSIPLVDYKALIPELDTKIKLDLDNFKFTSLITYNFKIKKKVKLNFQWCYFYDDDIDVSRMSIINNFNQSENQDDYYIVQMEVFRRNDETIDEFSIDKNVKNHLINFFKIEKKDIYFENKFFVEKAYPVPIIGVEEKRLKIIEYLKNHNIYQIGLYGKWKYMWSDQSFLDGYNFDYEN